MVRGDLIVEGAYMVGFVLAERGDKDAVKTRVEQAAVVGIDEVRRIRVRIQKREGAVAYGRRDTAGIGRQIASRGGGGWARTYCQISLRRRAVMAPVYAAPVDAGEIRAPHP